MKTLQISATEDTPSIQFIPEKGIFEFGGKSLPEDVLSFYQPIIDWLDEFENSFTKEACFKFKYKYFNTASSKIILDILFKLEEINQKNNNISIEWWHMEGDEDMQGAGEEYEEIVEMPFKYVSYKRGEI